MKTTIMCANFMKIIPQRQLLWIRRGHALIMIFVARMLIVSMMTPYAAFSVSAFRDTMEMGEHVNQVVSKIRYLTLSCNNAYSIFSCIFLCVIALF